MSKRTTPLIKHNAETGLSKRPNHPDFMDDYDLRRIEFTGIRPNPNRQMWEFWILGRIEKEVTFLTVSLDPLALTKAHLELFGIVESEEFFKAEMDKITVKAIGPNASVTEGKFFDDSKEEKKE